jgi:PAS domain S-box-containing protein
MLHRRRLPALLLGMIASLIVTLAFCRGLFSSPEFKVYDFHISHRPPLPTHPDLALILIDDRSMETLSRWPWSGKVHARMVDFLAKTCGVRAIVFDILFPEPNLADPAADAEFVRAVREAGNVFLAMHFTDYLTPDIDTDCFALARYAEEGERKGIFYRGACPPFSDLCAAAKGVGPVNVVRELDGVTRAVPLVLEYRKNPYLTLTGQVANYILNSQAAAPEIHPGDRLQLGPSSIPIDAAGEILINFSVPKQKRNIPRDSGGRSDPTSAQDYLTFSGPAYLFHEVLSPEFDPSALRGRIALIGFTATGLTDLHPIPARVGTPGVDINAQALNGLLQGLFLRKAPPAVNMAIIIIFGIGAALLLAPMRPLPSIAATAGLVGLLLGLSHYLFRAHGLWVATAAPASSVLFSYLLVMADAYRVEQRESLRSDVSISTLAQASRIIASSSSRQALLEAAQSQISHVMGAERADILLADESGERLVHVTTQAEAKGLPFSITIGEGMIGWIAEQGMPFVMNRVLSSKEVKAEARAIAGFPVNAVIYAPLCRKRRAIGVIQVSSSAKGEVFGARHMELLQALANAVVVALENVALYEQLEGKVEVANRELVRAYSDLGMERDRIAALLDNMADAVIMTDSNQRVRYLNAAAEHTFGISVHDVTKKPAKECLPYPALLHLFAGAGSEEASLSAQLTIESPVRRVLSARSVHITNPEDEWVGNVTVLTDITALHELSEMKSEFISLVSHELRTPLQSITGFTELLRGEGWANTRVKERDEFLGIILQECHRLLVMINDLLDISKMEVGRPLSLHLTEVDLEALVGKVVLFQSYTSDRHQLKVDLTPGLPKLQADSDKVAQILTNLISNAIKYSPGGGEVVVSGHIEGDKVVIGVTDQGVGMNEEQKASLFQPYQRVKREAIKGIRGTGLGLYLVKALVELHGGQIGVESEPGRGSCFHFSLPFIPPKAKKIEKPAN